SGYTRRVALRPFRWAVKLNSGTVVSFLSGVLALILPRNCPRRDGTEADQTRPSRWMVAAFRATVRPRADRYAQPQEHTACQPLRRSHPDSAVWVLAASATVAAMSRRRAARSV